eukprot:1158082-Pelagomonas_calceolata.AAC.3
MLQGASHLFYPDASINPCPGASINPDVGRSLASILCKSCSFETERHNSGHNEPPSVKQRQLHLRFHAAVSGMQSHFLIGAHI